MTIAMNGLSRDRHLKGPMRSSLRTSDIAWGRYRAPNRKPRTVVVATDRLSLLVTYPRVAVSRTRATLLPPADRASRAQKAW